MSENDRFLDSCVFDPHVEPPPERQLFNRFLPMSAQVVWIGREKHRKSNLLLQLAVCAAAGRSFLHFSLGAAGPQRVVYVDYESKTHSLKRRYEAVCRALELSEDERRLVELNLTIIEVRKLYKAGWKFPHFPVSEKAEEQYGSFWRDFAAQYPADIYIFDPMRSMHAEQENDSTIERLLTRMRQLFPNATVVVAQHMRKRANSKDGEVSLTSDMRGWSDGMRGSGAIKAHSDLIVCQERRMESEVEVVYLGAFGRDVADVEPMALVESDADSFCWKVSANVPEHLRPSFEALSSGEIFTTRSAMVQVIRSATGLSRSPAYAHIKQLENLGLLREQDGSWVVENSVSQDNGNN